jgi:ketosteroid isomerase-like protein
MSSAAENKSAILGVLKAYGQGDLEPLLALLDEKIEWTSEAQQKHFRFGGVRHGIVQVKEGLAALATDFSVLSFRVNETVAEGDIVWAQSDAEVRDNRELRTQVLAIASRYQFRNGKLIAVREFFDTAKAVDTFGTRPYAG